MYKDVNSLGSFAWFEPHIALWATKASATSLSVASIQPSIPASAMSSLPCNPAEPLASGLTYLLSVPFQASILISTQVAWVKDGFPIFGFLLGLRFIVWLELEILLMSGSVGIIQLGPKEIRPTSLLATKDHRRSSRYSYIKCSLWSGLFTGPCKQNQVLQMFNRQSLANIFALHLSALALPCLTIRVCVCCFSSLILVYLSICIPGEIKSLHFVLATLWGQLGWERQKWRDQTKFIHSLKQSCTFLSPLSSA